MEMHLGREYLKNLYRIECPDSTAREFPVVYKKGLGSSVWDVEGKKYTDLSAGFGALVCGHNHPEVEQSMLDYLKGHGVYHGLGDVHPSAAKIEYMQLLEKMLPFHLTKLMLSLTGSQAVEGALKTSILYTKKPGVICFKQGYHGLDLGAMLLTGGDKFRAPFSGWNRSSHVSHLDINLSREELESHIRQRNDSHTPAGCIIVEPVLGRSGVYPLSMERLRMFKSVCEEHDMLLVFDEVLTGLGRTGVDFLSSIVHADIVCLGKAVGGGMPLSVVATTDKVMQAWPKSQGEAIHTGTFFGHPLSCVVGRVTLEVVQKENLVVRSKVLGSKAIAFLKNELEGLPGIHEIRGSGLMIAVEYEKEGAGVQLMKRLLRDGVITVPSGSSGNVLSLTPALNIDEDLLMAALGKVCQHSVEMIHKR